MNKKAFTLIEVIIAISMLSIVMVAVFQIKQNNLNYLEKFKKTNKNNEYIAISNLYENNNSKDLNTKIYLNKLLEFKDDDINKELKNIKVYIKSKQINSIDLSSDDFNLNVEIYEKNYKIEDQINSNFYTFKLVY